MGSKAAMVSEHYLDITTIKLASELLLYQLLTQFLPGFDHEGEALGSPLLHARLDTMRAYRVDEQRH
jgi:hypothetical protein